MKSGISLEKGGLLKTNLEMCLNDKHRNLVHIVENVIC